jgi:Domain of unknown function (DUF222)/HNH endonuclease
MLLMAQPDAELASRLLELRLYIDQLELEFSQLAAEFEKSKHWERNGSTSAIDWMRFHCHMMSNAAADRIAVGDRSDEMLESTQALRAGDIGFAHLTVMARTANAVGDAFDEERLLQLARDNSPGKFHYQCLHYRHSVNSKQYAEDQAGLVHGNALHMSRAQDGTFFLTGFLDPVGGAVVRSALEPLARPLGKDDYRMRPQRMADALVELAGHKQKIQMQVTSSIETLLDLAGAPGAESEFSLPISAKTVERWACDCSLTRVLMQDSVVIDVGRAERTIRGPKRRALNARDQHCRWPGCERPASWCDGHHIVYWVHGGGDELENLVLLCARHHRMVHEGGWQLFRSKAGEIVTVAPTVTFSLPRGPD